MKLLMNACMNQHAHSNQHEVGRYVENVFPGIRLWPAGYTPDLMCRTCYHDRYYVQSQTQF